MLLVSFAYIFLLDGDDDDNESAVLGLASLLLVSYF